MAMVNRPLSETAVLTRAKLEVNNAIRIIQRRHAFTMTERIFDVTYPANTTLVDFGAVCSGKLRDLFSVQALGNDAAKGTVLKYKSFTKVTQERFAFQQSQPDNVLDLQADVERELGDFVRNVHKYYVFRMGESFGLFPVPKVAVPLRVHCHIWLPDLSNNADTNFLLDFALDTVLDLACTRMATFLRNPDLKVMSDEDFAKAMATLISWDSQLTESTYVTLG
jgi:hypothetical protein